MRSMNDHYYYDVIVTMEGAMESVITSSWNNGANQKERNDEQHSH